MVGGVVTRTEEGSPQGGPISPILANIYLHYVLDLWFEKKVRPTCKGEAYLTRFADDFVLNFQYAYSGRLRPAFRSDCDRYSGVIATGIPVGLRPPFRSIATG